MAANPALPTPALSIEEYLRTAYRPDVEYIDGELKEKPMVMSVHGRLQVLLGSWFDQHEEEWQILAAVEVRTRVAPTRVRLPDVVVDHARYWPETLVEPPLLVIDILSPTDTSSETSRRVRDFIAMGIKTIWVIDPETRKADVFGETPERAVTYLRVADSHVYVDLDQIFARLDKYQASDASKAAPAAEG